MVQFAAGVLVTLVVEAIVYAIYKSETKDDLLAGKLDVKFKEGISLEKGKKEAK